MKSVKRAAPKLHAVVVPSKAELARELDDALAGIPSDKPLTCPTVGEFMMDLKEKFNISSDYALAKRLDVTQKTVKTWRSGRGGFSDQMAMRVETELNLPRGYVVACMHAWREVTGSPLQDLWFSMAHMIEGATKALRGEAAKKLTRVARRSGAGVLLAGFLGMAGVHDARAWVNPVVSHHHPAGSTSEQCILCKVSGRGRTRRRRRFIDFLNPPPPPAVLAFA